MNSVYYEELRPAQFAQRIQEAPIAYLPLGTLEWHGLHLPLGADGLQARGAMRMLAERIGGIVLPMLFLGPDCAQERGDRLYHGMDIFSFEDGHAQQLAGSAYYIEDDRFAVLLDTVMRNLARAGFQIIMAHGHGPSTNFFADHAEEYHKRYGLECRTLFDLGYREAEGLLTDHAAANETSITMALHPRLVDLQALSPDAIPVASWGEDPRRHASAERGEALLERNVEKAAAELRCLLAAAKKQEINLRYHDVKSLISDPAVQTADETQAD